MRSRSTGSLALMVAASLAVTGTAAAQSPQPSPRPSIAPSASPSASPSGTPGGGATPRPTPAGTARATATPRAPAGTAGPEPAASGTPTASPVPTERATERPRESLTPAQRRIPPEVRGSSDAWPLPNQDYAARRRVPSSAIDAGSVDRLGVAWTASITDQSEYGYGAFATNPLVLDGRVYIQDLTSDVHVYDLASGSLVWETLDWNEPQLGPNGVAVGYGRVYAVRGAQTVVALDMADGTELWSVDLRTQNETEGITIQPIVYDGRVFLSTVPGTSNQDFYQGGVSGILFALDADTGDVVWRFDTDASGDLWGNEEVNSGGGAWYPPSIDVRDRTTYWGIGNPAPYPGTERYPAGASRPGKNLYTDSVVALRPDGTLEWTRQVRPHDLFDLDFQLPPILASVRIDGQDRQVAIGGGKNGEIVAFRRDNGRILWRTKVGRHENDDATVIPEEGLTVYPGTLGGIETPMAFSDGVVYAAYLDVSTTYSPTAVTNVGLDDDNGGVVAVDARNGKVLWETTEDSMVLGAVTVVNDLVLTATYDGRIIFLDRKTGDQVWSMQAPAGINGWPAVAGDTVLVPAGVGATPMLIALRLDATGEMPSPPSPSPAPSASAGPGASPAASAAPDASPQGPAGPVSPSPELPAGSPGPSGSPLPVASGSPLPVASPDASAAAGTTLEAAGTTLEEATTDAAPLAFTETELRAPAGTQVTVEYRNGVAVPHNIAFYEGSDGAAPLLGATEVETGPTTQTLTFTTPASPGTYLFRCDVHPDTMRGQLIVT